MKHRKTIIRTIPAQPERKTEVLVSEYTCDGCGTKMPEHNATGGYLPKLEGTVSRNTIVVGLTREEFSGTEDGFQRMELDYCDNCLPGIWKKITEILVYGSTSDT